MLYIPYLQIPKVFANATGFEVLAAWCYGMVLLIGEQWEGHQHRHQEQLCHRVGRPRTRSYESYGSCVNGTTEWLLFAVSADRADQ